MMPNYFENNSTKMAWYKTGEGNPLLILHGWGSRSSVMMPLANRLADIRTCFLPDFPGFGESPEPDTAWSVQDYSTLIEDFIKQTFPESKIDLLVHSYGARVALKLLAEEAVSSKIDKVIFTGAAGLRPKRSAGFYARKYTAKTLKLPFYLLPPSLRLKGLEKLRETSLWKKLGSSDYQALSGVMRETFVKSVNEYLDSLLPKINHEILLVWGRNDAAVPLEQGRRMEKGLQKSALVIMEDAGHYAFLDKPGEFTAIVRAYLEHQGKG